MPRLLHHALVLLVAAALALAPRCVSPEEDASLAASDAGDARRLGASAERPGSDAATPPARTPES